jgi:glycosyltransferase 2 family protein
VHSIGGTGAEALSYLLLLRFVLFVPITVAGLGVLLARYGGLRRVGVARAEAASA